MTLRLRRVETRELTRVSSFGAIYTMFRAIPFAKLVGLSGFITSSGFIAPALGVLLAPSTVVFSVALGTTIAFVFPWHPVKFFGLDFVPGAVYALIISLLVRGRRFEAVATYVSLILLFMANPNTLIFVGETLGSPPVPYLWMHLLALVVLISPLSSRAVEWLTSSSRSLVARGIAILAFIGTMAEHVAGGVLTALVLGPGAVKVWPAIFLLYPVERIVIVVAAAIVSTALLRSLKGLESRIA